VNSEPKPVRFSHEEAQAKLGHRVCSLLTLDGIAKGTFGRVMQIDEIEKNDFELIIEWDTRIEGKLQHDWFNKEQFEQCLVDEVS